jgi:hypothetical protein
MMRASTADRSCYFEGYDGRLGLGSPIYTSKVLYAPSSNVVWWELYSKFRMMNMSANEAINMANEQSQSQMLIIIPSSVLKSTGTDANGCKTYVQDHYSSPSGWDWWIEFAQAALSSDKLSFDEAFSKACASCPSPGQSSSTSLFQNLSSSSSVSTSSTTHTLSSSSSSTDLLQVSLSSSSSSSISSSVPVQQSSILTAASCAFVSYILSFFN